MMSWLQSWLSKRSPWVFENSKIPVWLSKIAPIEIHAISFVCFVFCREALSKTMRRHETIHYHQQLELLFVGFWTLYVLFYLRGLLRHRNGKEAYRNNPFESEAYDNERKMKYLERRQFWAWRAYV
tara:strand:- start:329 stop:706 length:378 start_codon:yes stop_codon:yes gene_type:complete